MFLNLITNVAKKIYYMSNYFGFENSDQFFASLIKPKLLIYSLFTLPFFQGVEIYFGLKPVAFLALCALLTLELVTGILASLLEGSETNINSRRLKSFGALFVSYFVTLFVIKSMEIQFNDNHEMNKYFNYLFDFFLIYILFVYFRSIFENFARIRDNKDDFARIIDYFKGKLK